MEARNIVSLPTPALLPATIVRTEGDRIVVDRLTLVDPGLAAFVADRPMDDRPALVERALKIGLVALQDAGVTVNVDVVRREFEGLLQQSQATNERAAAALEQTLRTNFADGDGRLPRTLEKFLGDRGQLRVFVADLFDESKRDSAIGRIGQLLGTYFDGDASKLARLIDPTRLGSPMYQFREEVSAGFAKLNDRLTAIEAAATARASERSKSAAKGGDFEDMLEAMLGDLARANGDLLDRTGGDTGDVMKSKKGDFVLTVNEGLARGADLRIVVEAKDRAISGRAIRDELREAKTNRGAAVGLVVFTPAHAPDRHRAVRHAGRRRLLRHRPARAGPGDARGRGAARAPRGRRHAARARGRDRRRGGVRGPGRDPRAARAHQGAQEPAHVGRHGHEGRLERPRPPPREHPGPRLRGRIGAPPGPLTRVGPGRPISRG